MKLANGKSRELYSWIELYNQVKGLANSARSRYNTATRWTSAVSSDNRLYETVHAWFVGQIEDTAPPRAIELRQQLTHEPGDQPVNRLLVYFDQNQDRTVQIEGHSVRIELAREGRKPKSDGQAVKEDDGWSLRRPDILYFHAKSHEGQQAVVRLFQRLVEQKIERKPALYLMSQWGSWDRRDDLPQRPLESVVLAQGQMERIRDDLSQFLDAETEYTRRGIPYHRAYLLEGPPGTGKTSIVRALAAYLGLDLWYLPLSDLSKDGNLLNAIAGVRARGILLIEDIHTYPVFRRQSETHIGNEDHQAVSMAGVLNAMDGVATPHGLVTFLTTNLYDELDPSFLRSGRIDVTEHIGLPDKKQAYRMWAQFYDQPYDPSLTHMVKLDAETTTADLAGLFTRHLDDPSGAFRELTGG